MRAKMTLFVNAALLAAPFVFAQSSAPAKLPDNVRNDPVSLRQLSASFEELAARWGIVELAGEPERLRSNFIGGIKSLPISVEWR